MKSFLLAAGRGTRLKPLTDSVPKCLVLINGKPLIHYWLELCERHGITEVLINLHHLPEKVIQFIESSSYRVKIHTIFEEKLLGTAGTVFSHRDFVRDEERFFIFYADNLTNADVAAMRNFHERKGSLFTMGLFRADEPQSCGIATLNEDDRVIEFVEKPSSPRGNLANAGIYLAEKEIFQYFPRKEFMDFGFDILPQLIGKMHGYEIKEYLLDIGTYENYQRAQREWRILNSP